MVLYEGRIKKLSEQDPTKARQAQNEILALRSDLRKQIGGNLSAGQYSKQLDQGITSILEKYGV